MCKLVSGRMDGKYTDKNTQVAARLLTSCNRMRSHGILQLVDNKSVTTPYSNDLNW